MADSKKATIDFAVITKVLVGLMLIFMGIAGLVNTRGTDFTRPLFNFLDEEAFIYIVSVLVAVAGLGLIAAVAQAGECQFTFPVGGRLPGDPSFAAEIMAKCLFSVYTACVTAAGADLFPVAILRAGGADLIFQLIVMAICAGIFRSA